MGSTVEECICCGSRDLEFATALWMPFVSHRAMNLAPMKIDRSFGLRTVPDGTAFSLCKSLMCHDCGHLFADYRFSETEMTNLYTEYRGSAYTALRETYEPGYAARNAVISEGIFYMQLVEDFLRPFVPESAIAVLDWGGDTGTNTPFRERRSLLHIFDPSVRDTGSDEILSFSEVPEDLTKYDLIVLSNVLEHIPFPSETLAAIRPFMSPETTLYVEVPLENLQRSALQSPYTGAHRKKYWHEHINFFTPTSMERLLTKAGFTVQASKILDLSSSHEEALGSAMVLLQYACKL